MLMRAGSEALVRQVLRDVNHDRWAGRHLPDVGAARSNDRDAVDRRSTRLYLEVDLLRLVVAETFGDDLPEVVAAGEPTELIRHRLRAALCPRRDRHHRRCGDGRACPGSHFEEFAPIE